MKSSLRFRNRIFKNPILGTTIEFRTADLWLCVHQPLIMTRSAKFLPVWHPEIEIDRAGSLLMLSHALPVHK